MTLVTGAGSSPLYLLSGVKGEYIAREPSHLEMMDENNISLLIHLSDEDVDEVDDDDE